MTSVCVGEKVREGRGQCRYVVCVVWLSLSLCSYM